MPAWQRRTRRCVHARPASGPVETAIAAHAAGLIEDRATLQCGLGAIPEAVLAALHDRRDLGVHSGAIGDGVMALMEAGRGHQRPQGASTAACHDRRRADGQRAPASLRTPQPGAADARHRLHARRRRAGLAAALRRHQLGGGGRSERPGERRGGGRLLCRRGRRRGRLRARRAPQPRAACRSSPCPRARARTAASSPRLSGPVSTPRCDAGVFVTEYGIADLRGLPLAARRRRMLDIAHPEHRARLEREARPERRHRPSPERRRPFTNDPMRQAFIVSPLAHARRHLRRRLRSVPVEELAATVVRQVVQRSGIDPARIDDTVFAQSYANSETPCVGRWVALQAGLPVAVPGMQLDRRCGGGLQAIATAAMMVQSGSRRRGAGRRRGKHEQHRVLLDRHALGRALGLGAPARPARARARTIAARGTLRPHLGNDRNRREPRARLRASRARLPTPTPCKAISAPMRPGQEGRFADEVVPVTRAAEEGRAAGVCPRRRHPAGRQPGEPRPDARR